MDKETKKGISKTVFVISLILSLLVGVGGGVGLSIYLFTNYFGVGPEMFGAHMSGEGGMNDSYEELARRDILFYKPGNSRILWNDSYEAIPEGDGAIKGRIFVNDEPAKGLEISLILAKGRRTEKQIVDGDGKYRLSLPKDDYYLNGIAIYNMHGLVDEKIFVNGLARHEGEDFGKTQMDNKEVLEEFEKLSEKYGKEEASKKLAEKMMSSTTMGRKFPFKVAGAPFIMPDLHYRDAIKVASPISGSIINLDDIHFIWAPSPAATSYKVHLDRIEKKGRTTSYHPVLTRKGIKESNITYKELLAMKPPDEECSPWEEEEKDLKKGKTYGMKIIGYNEAGKVVTASSEFGPDAIKFKVE